MKDKKKPGLSQKEKRKAFIRKIYDSNPVGAPRKYQTADELQASIIEYFDYCIDEDIPLTITGLTLYIGFSDRASFYDYEKKPEFTHTIKKAREVLTNHYETKINTDAFCTGAIFALKNLGWKAEEQREDKVTLQTEFYVGGDDEDEDQENEDWHK